MKRMLTLILALVLAFSLASCKSSKAAAVDKQILAIGEITPDSGDAIAAAEQAVEALSEKDRSTLENIMVLKNARQEYDELIRKLEEEAADKEAAKAVEDMIAAIGEVTFDSGDAIQECRTAYDALTDTQKEYVPNLDTLTAAEERLPQVRAETAIALIDAIGDSEFPDEAPLKAVTEVLEVLSEDELALVTNLEVYQAKRHDYDCAYAATLLKDVKVWYKKERYDLAVFVNFINNSDKVIKYITFYVSFYNPVGDILQCSKSDYAGMRDIGPYAKGEGRQGSYWRWEYSSYQLDYEVVNAIELVQIEIEYMDGTTVTLSKEMSQAVLAK